MKKQQKRFSAYELEKLENELKKLGQPAIPADLEERLLASIPAQPAGRGDKESTRSLYGVVGWAAALIIGLGISLYYFQEIITSPKELVLNGALTSRDEIIQVIENEALSARLLASANILAQQPTGISFAQDTYRYLIASYPDTTAGQEAKKLLVKQDKEIQ